MNRKVVFLFLCGICLPVVLEAQNETGSSVSLVGNVGFYGSRGSLMTSYGEASPGRLVAVQMDESPVLGLSLLVPVLSDRLVFRTAIYGTVGSNLQTVVFEGQESCGTNCYRFVYSTSDAGRAVLWAGTAGALLSPTPVEWTLRPYLIAGVGLKYFGYKHQFPQDIELAAKSQAALELGAGFEIPYWRKRFRFEILHLGSADGGQRQRDIYVTAGVEVGIPRLQP